MTRASELDPHGLQKIEKLRLVVEGGDDPGPHLPRQQRGEQVDLVLLRGGNEEIRLRRTGFTQDLGIPRVAA